MKSLKFPFKTQIVFWAVLWFLICLSFQSLLVYRISHINNFIDVSVSCALLLVSVFFIFILQRYAAVYFNNIYTRLGLMALLVLKVVYVQNFLIKNLIHDDAYLAIYPQTAIIRVFSAFLVISFFSILLWMVFHIKKLNNDALIKQNAENYLREAELTKLRQQMQPHFLFNSLNSINALIGSQPEQARKMIQTLSDFLRGTLKKDENKAVLFSEEIELLRLYLDIEKIRFGHRLIVNFNIDEMFLNKTIPPLLLQPVVENAIKFGLYNVLDKVEIDLQVLLKDNMMVITVSNPFDEDSAMTRKGEGFGLSLIKRRLQLIYHRSDLLKTEKIGRLYKTSILIPQT